MLSPHSPDLEHQPAELPLVHSGLGHDFVSVLDGVDYNTDVKPFTLEVLHKISS